MIREECWNDIASLEKPKISTIHTTTGSQYLRRETIRDTGPWKQSGLARGNDKSSCERRGARLSVAARSMRHKTNTNVFPVPVWNGTLYCGPTVKIQFGLQAEFS